MSENKKYYYLKFKENYFEQDQIRVIEGMDNGYIYSLIILKLYLKSLKFEGQLKINETIPYAVDKIELLSKVINHDSDHLKSAIKIAKELGIIEIMSSGEIFMADIQNFIGHSSSEGERKKEYRKRIKSSDRKKLTCKDKNETMSQNQPPELELELELEKDINIKKQIDEIYNLYPYKDINNNNRSTSKSKKDKYKIKQLIKKLSYEKVKTIIEYSLRNFSEKKTWLKNFSTFLNQFPDLNEIENNNKLDSEFDSYIKGFESVTIVVDQTGKEVVKC